MDLHLYSDELFSIQIEGYAFGEVLFTEETPKKIIEYSVVDKDQYAVAISDDRGKLIGFFCLHLGAGPASFGYHGHTYALIRGLSIDARYRGLGYGSKCFEKIFEFIHAEISEEVTCLILGVNTNNIWAKKAYEKADFKQVNKWVDGKFGKLLVMEKAQQTA